MEKKRSLDSNTQSHVFFNALVKNLPVCLIEIDNAGEIQFVNDYLIQLSGMSLSEWQRRSIQEIAILLPAENDIRQILVDLKSLGEFTCELRILIKTGHELILNSSWYHFSSLQSPDTILLFCEDKTPISTVQIRLKELEEEYKISDRLLRGTFDSFPDVLGIQGPDHEILRYNKAGYDYLGVKEEEVIGKKCYEILDNQEPCLNCATSKVYKSKKPEKIERYLENSERWLDCRAYPIFDEDGTLQYVIEHLRDITEEKLSEKKLHLFKSAVESSTDAITMLTLDGKTWYRNRAFIEIFGKDYKKPEELLVLPELAANVSTLLKSGQEYTGEVEMLSEAREVINVLARIYPIKNYHDDIIGSVAVLTDITDRKAAEKRIEQSEEQYRNIYESSLAGLWRTRISDGKFIKANMTTARFLGFDSVEELLDNTYSVDLYRDSTDRSRLMKHLETDGYVKEFVVPFKLKNGEHRDFLISARVFPEEDYIEGVVTDITAQKRAEEALIKIEEDLRTTLNSIGDAVITTDIYGRINRFNPAAEALTECAAKHAVGKKLLEILYLYDSLTGDKLPNPVTDILKHGKVTLFPEHIELITHKNNKRRILDSGAPIKDSNGNITGVVLIFRDISREIQMKEFLKDSEERFRSLTELLPVGIFECDLDLNLTFVNSTCLKIFGYARADIDDRLNGYDMFTESSRKKAVENLQRRLSGETIRVVEYECIRKNGEVFSALFYVSPVAMEFDKQVGLRGVIIDITDRKNTEIELKTSEEFSSSLLENSPHPIVVMNPDTTLKYVNPAFEKLTGFRAETILNRQPPFPWWPGESHDKISHDLQQLLDQELKVIEQQYRKTDGTRFWVEISSSQIRLDNGDLKNYICSWVETTDRREMEEKLRQISLHDSLTGLFNRAFFEEEMNRLSVDRHHPISIVICDIDGLKLINETMGHHEGDNLLKSAARILKSSFRRSDIIARIGGDEFAIILPRTSMLATRTCCRRIQNNLKEFNKHDNPFYLSISVGYAASEEIQADLNELFKIADHNMYRQKLQQSHSTKSDIVQSLIKTMEQRDFFDSDQMSQMQVYASELGKQMSLPEAKIEDLELLCRFHDLGIISISEDILFKQEPLSIEEYNELQSHCEVGYRIALSVSDLAPIADFILKHHEWWNGEGYPLGLKGEEIPLESRILAIVDAYDAMVNQRPYKDPKSHTEAVEELKLCAGEQFDPHLVKLFVRILDN